MQCFSIYKKRIAIDTGQKINLQYLVSESESEAEAESEAESEAEAEVKSEAESA